MSRWELSQRVPFSAAMIQRIEDGQRDMPEGYEAACLRALDVITAERRNALLAVSSAKPARARA